MRFDWLTIWQYRKDLLDGLAITLYLSAAGIVGATLIGVLFGSMLSSQNFFVRKFAALYVEVMRNIPMIVKAFFLYFVVGIDAMPAGIVALVVHQGGYIADLVAAGMRAIPRGQLEAAFSTNLSRRQAFRWILLPQLIRYVIPPLTSQYTQIVKNTSIVALLTIEELTFVTRKIESETFRGLEAATTVTLLYLALVVVVVSAMSLWARHLERKYS